MTLATVRYFGVAAYEIVNSQGQHILIDPFLDDNPGSPIRASQLERVDLVLVTHGAFDHLGDTLAIAKATGAPVVCGTEVKAMLEAQGLPESQIRTTTWGIAVQVAGVQIQPVESHHWSIVRLPDGNYVTGVPMGFVVYVEPGIRFYHCGDTALFSDLKLIGQLYQPTIGSIGISQPKEILARIPGPGQILTGEMTPLEGALAAAWLGLQTVLPSHYLDAECDEIKEFANHIRAGVQQQSKLPEVVVLRPGDSYTLKPTGVDTY